MAQSCFDIILPDSRSNRFDEGEEDTLDSGGDLSPASVLVDTPPPSVSPPLMGMGAAELLHGDIDPMLNEAFGMTVSAASVGEEEAAANVATIKKELRNISKPFIDLDSIIDDLDLDPSGVYDVNGASGSDMLLSGLQAEPSATDLLGGLDASPEEDAFHFQHHIKTEVKTEPKSSSSHSAPATPQRANKEVVKMVRLQDTLSTLRAEMKTKYGEKSIGMRPFVFMGQALSDQGLMSDFCHGGTSDFVRITIELAADSLPITDVRLPTHLQRDKTSRVHEYTFETQADMSWHSPMGVGGMGGGVNGAGQGSLLLQSYMQEEKEKKQQQFLASQYAKRACEPQNQHRIAGQHWNHKALKELQTKGVKRGASRPPTSGAPAAKSAKTSSRNDRGGSSRSAASAAAVAPKKVIPDFKVSEQFRRTTASLHYPELVSDWQVAHVKEFARWARTAFQGIRINIKRWEMDGRALVALSDRDFCDRVDNDANGLFFKCWVTLKTTNVVTEPNWQGDH